MPSDQTSIVKEVVAELLDLDEESLTPDGPLADLEGWDSVNALRVLVFLERELGAAVDYERFMAAGTIAEVAAVVADAGADTGADAGAGART